MVLPQPLTSDDATRSVDHDTHHTHRLCILAMNTMWLQTHGFILGELEMKPIGFHPPGGHVPPLSFIADRNVDVATGVGVESRF